MVSKVSLGGGIVANRARKNVSQRWLTVALERISRYFIIRRGADNSARKTRNNLEQLAGGYTPARGNIVRRECSWEILREHGNYYSVRGSGEQVERGEERGRERRKERGNRERERKSARRKRTEVEDDDERGKSKEREKRERKGLGGGREGEEDERNRLRGAKV